MPTINDFLERGYFPKELPPFFTTAAFAASVPLAGVAPTAQDVFSASVRYSHSKYASTRRDLRIPHPAPHYELVSLLVNSWPDLQRVWGGSTLGKSSPVDSPVRAVTGQMEFSDLPALRAEVRAAGRYLFRADISAFYPSVYTHSIPWAIHGKAAAKANWVTRPSRRHPAVLWGNLADLWSRNSQGKQTVGLPIGPDTSFVLAETVLCAVDAELQNQLGPHSGFRFVDDYEFVCEDQPEAERAFALLQEVLSRFELRLNPRKTSIVELPEALDAPWVEELSDFDFDAARDMSRRLVRYFTRAFSLVRQYPGEPVLKYAIRRLVSLEVEGDEALLLQRLALQAAMADPGTLRGVLLIISTHEAADLETDHDALNAALNSLVQRHAPLGHGSEVAWSIWAAAVFDSPLSEASANAVAQMRDEIVALSAMFCEEHGAFDRPPNRQNWQEMVDADALAQEHWLLTYEAVGKAWLNPPPRGDLVDAGPFLQALRAATVAFIDPATPLEISDDLPEGPYRA